MFACFFSLFRVALEKVGGALPLVAHVKLPLDRAVEVRVASWRRALWPWHVPPFSPLLSNLILEKYEKKKK